MNGQANIEDFWDKMRAVYGRQQWDREFPIEDCAEIWESALGRFEPKHILQAIGDAVRSYPDRAPTLPQFLGLCRSVRRSQQEPEALGRVDIRAALEHVTEVRQLMELKRGRPMTEEQRQIHLETLKL